MKHMKQENLDCMRSTSVREIAMHHIQLHDSAISSFAPPSSGQHIPQSERVAPFRDDMGLVDRILYNMDRQRHIDDLEAARRDAEEGYQEFETDDEDDNEEEEGGKEDRKDEEVPAREGSAMNVDELDGGAAASDTPQNNENDTQGLSVEERDELKAEFRSLMENRFVEGNEVCLPPRCAHFQSGSQISNGLRFVERLRLSVGG